MSPVYVFFQFEIFLEFVFCYLEFLIISFLL